MEYINSDINKALIKGYPDAEIKESKEVTSTNVTYVYEELNNLIRDSNVEDELKPQVFNYFIYDKGVKYIERTCIVSNNEYSEVSTYFKAGKQWSTIEIAQMIPEGIIIADFSLPAGIIPGYHGSTEVNISLVSNEAITKNGYKAKEVNPGRCRSSSFQRTYLLGAQLAHSSEQELVKAVSSIPSMGVNNLYNQLMQQIENAKKQDSEIKM